MFYLEFLVVPTSFAIAASVFLFSFVVLTNSNIFTLRDRKVTGRLRLLIAINFTLWAFIYKAALISSLLMLTFYLHYSPTIQMVLIPTTLLMFSLLFIKTEDLGYKIKDLTVSFYNKKRVGLHITTSLNSNVVASLVQTAIDLKNAGITEIQLRSNLISKHHVHQKVILKLINLICEDNNFEYSIERETKLRWWTKLGIVIAVIIKSISIQSFHKVDFNYKCCIKTIQRIPATEGNIIIKFKQSY